MTNLLISEWKRDAVLLAEEAARRYPKVTVSVGSNLEIQVEVDEIISGVLGLVSDMGWPMTLLFEAHSPWPPRGTISSLHNFVCAMSAVVECAAWLETKTAHLVIWDKTAPCGQCGGSGCLLCAGTGQRQEKENETP
jgi:hypothetical protein